MDMKKILKHNIYGHEGLVVGFYLCCMISAWVSQKKFLSYIIRYIQCSVIKCLLPEVTVPWQESERSWLSFTLGVPT